MDKSIKLAANIHNIDDYYNIYQDKELGVEKFSTVKLAQSLINQQYYAIKIIDKNIFTTILVKNI